jgi:hypothetical protein
MFDEANLQDQHLKNLDRDQDFLSLDKVSGLILK